MPLQTKPEDKPAAVRFHLGRKGKAVEITCSLLPHHSHPPFRIEGDAPRFKNRDSFKAKVVAIGMTPAVAEDEDRSFNATARQLQSLGFSVQVEKDAA